jgi:hypothetical protein
LQLIFSHNPTLRFLPVVQAVQLREKQAAFIHQKAAGIAIGAGVQNTAKRLFEIVFIGGLLQWDLPSRRITVLSIAKRHRHCFIPLRGF